MIAFSIPALNASLNGLAATLLILGFFFIKRGNKTAHRNCMVAAFITSAIFLVGYVSNRVIAQAAHTPFSGEGSIRTVYYVMLITHLILAIAMVPMIFMTMARARRGDFEAHKRMARWTWPIWIYVSITGVLIYFFLYQWWPGTS